MCAITNMKKNTKHTRIFLIVGILSLLLLTTLISFNEFKSKQKHKDYVCIILSKNLNPYGLVENAKIFNALSYDKGLTPVYVTEEEVNSGKVQC